MCGIAGIFRLDGGVVEEWRLAAMKKAMVHRGPDGEGVWIEGPAGLAHVRLAIIDLATGEQPMFNEDGTVVGIFNGEIYNFLDLRAALKELGHTFRTNSDTEVLIHAYEEWGSAMVSNLNGMFAFALYDRRRRTLFFAGDRLGVKPLYYYRGQDVLVFASEMGGLLASGLIPRNIDTVALDLYLHYQYIPSPYTIYQDVKKLSPAEGVEVDISSGHFKTARYWDLKSEQPNHSKSLAGWLDELAALLDDAVRIRLISDVPFGAFLSGGTDSGLTVAMMAGKLSEPVKTFSIGLADVDKDELPYARMVAERYKTQHHEFRVSPDGLMLIPKLCSHFGEPFADSSAVPTYYVSQLASSEVKMVLTGDGGDEMFAGYRTYPALVDTAPEGLPSARTLPPSPWRTYSWRETIQKILGIARDLAGRVQAGEALHGHRSIPWYQQHDLSMSHFSFDERQALLGQNALSDHHYLVRRYPFPSADSVVMAAQYCDLKSYLPGDILVKVDRMSMANSLEVRSPLLDYRIAELAFSMPTALKLPEPRPDGSKSKFTLKELACRYLDCAYVYRPKEGFGIPVNRWLREDKADYLKDTLLSSASPVYNHLHMDLIRRMIQSHLEGTGDYSAKLWNILMLDGWLRYVHTS